MPEDPRNQGKNALKQADRATRRGDLAAAERWTRIAERMAEAAHKLADIPAPPEESAEAIRAELARIPTGLQTAYGPASRIGSTAAPVTTIQNGPGKEADRT